MTEKIAAAELMCWVRRRGGIKLWTMTWTSMDKSVVATTIRLPDSHVGTS